MTQVVVVGGSVAGLLAAAALARCGADVLLVERDGDPGGRLRPGVPQSGQPHVYLKRGLLAIETLLPGFADRLRAAGARPFDTGELAWLGEQGWSPMRPAYEVLSVSRPVFETQLRATVGEVPGVRFREGCRVVGLRAGDRWSVDCRTGEEADTVAADLVVDASGRSSRLPAWLADLGLPTPREEIVDARLGYASFDLQPAPEFADLPGMVVTTTVEDPRGGLALAVEDGRWVVGVIGMGEDRPDRDLASVLEFLGSLRDPAMAAFVAAGTVLSEVRVHRQTRNRRFRYEQLPALPPGLLVVGDALCCFDPIYGQGVTVAALQAAALRAAFVGGVSARRTPALQRRLAREADVPWGIATGQDLRYRSSEGELSGPARLTDAWARYVARMGVHGNHRAVDTLSGVYHLMVHPARLFHPALIAAALRSRLAGLGPAATRPAVLDVLAS